MSKLKAIWDGEPVVWISGLLVAVGSLAGVKWTDGQVQAVLVALTPLIGAVITRTKTTPAPNPTIPTVMVEDAAGAPVEVPKAVTPVWTFPTGTRGPKVDEG